MFQGNCNFRFAYVDPKLLFYECNFIYSMSINFSMNVYTCIIFFIVFSAEGYTILQFQNHLNLKLSDLKSKNKKECGQYNP